MSDRLFENESAARVPRLGLPDLGIGVGLRIPHYETVFASWPTVDWFEIISENFLIDGGRPLENLGRAMSHYRVVQHGVSLSIGSTQPLDFDYLRKVKALIARTGSPWVSDHLCWTGTPHANLHDLLPLPYTEEALEHVATRAKTVQDYLETRLCLENVSSYLTYRDSTMTEWEFYAELAERADIGLLFDVNNVYVSSQNHGFDPNLYVDAVPAHRVVQIHLAGHTRLPKYIIDTHSGPVIDPVWELYRRTIARTGSVSTLIEWDDDLPAFDVLLEEAQRARQWRDRAVRERTLEARIESAAP